MTAPRALLLSSSRVPGREEYLTWAADELRDFLGPVTTATFVPFAGVTIAWEEYAARTAEAFATIGVRIEPFFINSNKPTAASQEPSGSQLTRDFEINKFYADVFAHYDDDRDQDDDDDRR